jgi:hypothetical protein
LGKASRGSFAIIVSLGQEARPASHLSQFVAMGGAPDDFFGETFGISGEDVPPRSGFTDNAAGFTVFIGDHQCRDSGCQDSVKFAGPGNQ